ncbi:Hypothetical predicted protein [Octopus vulgaris]|uniref:Uncharacterized protein n=1 Tax=Octopus vulgaris TaxID=6645 RepID=A0AA36FF79_OCTVU|nr:Hypothetical predicted protein [Octopus vulgaris]
MKRKRKQHKGEKPKERRMEELINTETDHLKEDSENIRLNRIHRDPYYISRMPNATKFSQIEQWEILALKMYSLM